MNVLGLVFSLLLILSYTFFSIADKHTTSTRVRNVCHGTHKANRDILNQYQSLTYKNLSNKPKVKDEPAAAKTGDNKPKPPKPNQECAKFNLSPLIQEGRKTHPQLYELTAKMLRTLYGQNLFEGKKRAEYNFLDALITSAQGKDAVRIEKLVLPTPEYQRIYYKMLKGTKKYNLAAHEGIAPLPDFLKIEPSKVKICICHAHPDVLAALFSVQVANILYPQIHQKSQPAVTKEMVENACMVGRYTISDPMMFELFELGRHIHPESKKTLLAEDKDVTLRKNVYLLKG